MADKQQLRDLRAAVEAVIEDDHEGSEMLAILIVDRVVEPLVADRDRAREIAVALEQQLAEIKRLAYMGGQNGEVVRGWIIGVLERANATDPQGQQDIHVCSPQTCGAVYNQEEDGL
jgi:hypothetical protein